MYKQTAIVAHIFGEIEKIHHLLNKDRSVIWSLNTDKKPRSYQEFLVTTWVLLIPNSVVTIIPWGNKTWAESN